MRRKKRKQELPPGCRGCRGVGQLSFDAPARDPLTGEMVEVSATVFCDCPRGIWRRQQWERRKFLTGVR